MDNGKEHQTVIGRPVFRADPHFARLWLRALLRDFQNGWPAMHSVAGVFRNGDLCVEVDSDAMHRVATAMAETMILHPEVLGTINAALDEAITALHQGMHVLPQEGLHACSNEELWAYYQRHESLHESCAALGWPVVLPEQAGGLLEAWVRQRIPDADAVSILLAPDAYTVAEQEQRDFLSLVAEMQHDGRLAREFCARVAASDYDGALAYTDPRWLRRLEDHHRRYCFSEWLLGGARPLSSYLEDIAGALREDLQAATRLAEQENQRVSLAAERERILVRYGCTEAERAFLDALRQALALKPLRRYIQQYALYRFDPVMDEIARRISTAADMARWLLPEEIEGALLRSRGVSADAMRRREASRYVASPQGHWFELLDDEAPAASLDRFDARELRGLTASRGFGRGNVFKLAGAEFMKDVPEGCVLVIDHARPEYTQVFKKAAAVVCEQGGVTSHTALIARELGVPCVVAAKRAAAILRDGMEVEVDANRGIVRLV